LLSYVRQVIHQDVHSIQPASCKLDFTPLSIVRLDLKLEVSHRNPFASFMASMMPVKVDIHNTEDLLKHFLLRLEDELVEAIGSQGMQALPQLRILFAL
jgi:hypothetical protein